jgi:hypothetical protein
MPRPRVVASFLVLVLVANTVPGRGFLSIPVAHAQSADGSTLSLGSSPTAAAGAARPAQGLAVLAIGDDTKDDAFALARAVYASRAARSDQTSSLRPLQLDEVRARVLAGGPLPANASRELRELSELRSAIRGNDAATRRLLLGIAQQLNVEGLLVVGSTPPASADVREPNKPTTPAVPAEPAGPRAAAPTDAAETATTPERPRRVVVARLFLVEGRAGAAGGDQADFDAAHYEADPEATGPAAWAKTVTSLEGRFPPVSRRVVTTPATSSDVSAHPAEKSRPFYSSGWFWGALGGAALLAGAFLVASRDTGSDSIHLRMRVP